MGKSPVRAVQVCAPWPYLTRRRIGMHSARLLYESLLFIIVMQNATDCERFFDPCRTNAARDARTRVAVCCGCGCLAFSSSDRRRRRRRRIGPMAAANDLCAVGFRAGTKPRRDRGRPCDHCARTMSSPPPRFNQSVGGAQ